MLWTSLVHLSQTKKRFSKISGLGSKLRAAERIVRRAVAAAEEAGKSHHFVDHRQVSVEVDVFLQKLCQLAPAAEQLALDPANRQMRMEAALFLGIAKLRF